MSGGREFRREVGSRLVIGRDMECDVRVDDPKISRLHCLIERKGGEYVAVDLDSHNGTMISGWPLTRQTLKHGDVLDMGVASLQFLVESARKAGEEADCLASEETLARESAQSTEPPDPASVARRGPAGRKASLWEHAMRASEPTGKKARKRKRVKPEVLRKQLLAGRTSMGVEEPLRIVRHPGSSPWYYRTVPLKLGIPASLVLIAVLYVLANGMPSLNLGGAARDSAPKSLPHSSPHNND
jgi:pSer/pThr/pTyr-binding forkhead associated (FHA) protein